MTASALPALDVATLANLDGYLFDLDGVLTPTAAIHQRAWHDLFVALLGRLTPDQPYTTQDYFDHVDGKPRFAGVADLLASRGIDLPWGTPSDPPGEDTVCALGNRKNDVFLEIVEREGVDPYPGSVRLLDILSASGTPMAVVSSSRNARQVLSASGLAPRFSLVVDGLVADAEGLAGKPSGETYRWAAEALGIAIGRACVVEDAPSGVAAGRDAAAGLVLGVNRGAGAQELLEGGADVVVDDLAEVADALAAAGGAR